MSVLYHIELLVLDCTIGKMNLCRNSWCITARVGQTGGLMCPKVSDMLVQRQFFLYRLMISVWLLWVRAHVGGILPECRCRQGSGSELCRGEQPCTEGSLEDAPLNLCLGWAGGEIWH